MPDKPAIRYLKNASIRRDEAEDYWLFIEAGDLHAMFLLSAKEGSDEDSIERRCLAAFIAEQDSGNGKTKLPGG